MEVTNKNPDIRVKESYRQLVHRTVVMQKSAEGWLWATDDPLGPLSEYHHSDGLLTRSKLIFSKLDAKERSSIGRLLERLPIIGKRIKERWNYEVGIQELCDIGMHVRSMVDVGNGFVIITEAKNPGNQSASEVFFVLKSDLSKKSPTLRDSQPTPQTNGCDAIKEQYFGTFWGFLLPHPSKDL